MEEQTQQHRQEVRGLNGVPLPAEENLFFAAVRSAPMPMLITDPRLPDHPIIAANNAFCELTGYAMEEIVGRNCRFLQGADTDANAIAQVRDAIAEQREISIELINYRKDGSPFWNALYISPVSNDAGEVIYFFASQLDVSRRRTAEDGLRQAQKMEALGQLTGGIAHDFNNLLQVMTGYLDLIRISASKGELDPEQILSYTSRARSATERASTLTQQLLAFSRKQKLEGRVLNLNSLIASSNAVSQRTLPDVALIVRQDDALWNCRVDATQVEVALLNVLLNARDALAGRDQPAVTVETKNISVSALQGVSFDGLAPGRYVSVAISDNGTGIPSAIRDRVMDPFFTTKEEGRGTGLGLSMVYGFVKQSGGALRVYSEEGIGTTIRMYFPAIDAPAEESEAASVDPAQRGCETVLIVEDRPEVADLARVVLEGYGYRCAVSHNAADALDALSSASYDLLFTDLIMPGGMNGVMLAREAKQRHPGIRVLLTTGYAESAIERTDAGGSALDVISKPYLPAELARKVRGVLGSVPRAASGL